MSLDQRCQQFHEAALGTGKSKGAVKEIATLRKFLHKNQSQTFTDRSVKRLFDTIQIYWKSETVDRDTKEALLEDALKMPFSLFSAKQKNSMLKGLEELRVPDCSNSTVTTSPSAPATQLLAVIDLDEDTKTMTLMQNETGDTYDHVPLPEESSKAICDAFRNEENVVSVEAVVEGEQVQRMDRFVVES
mmetsp:Transcript_2810/g.7879  ORF Transcript_2810/g.7879 Transcript_2810/m.7879 type:complete len:189 (+) Transcript_2810:50-616(+)